MPLSSFAKSLVITAAGPMNERLIVRLRVKVTEPPVRPPGDRWEDCPGDDDDGERHEYDPGHTAVIAKLTDDGRFFRVQPPEPALGNNFCEGNGGGGDADVTYGRGLWAPVVDTVEFGLSRASKLAWYTDVAEFTANPGILGNQSLKRLLLAAKYTVIPNAGCAGSASTTACTLGGKDIRAQIAGSKPTMARASTFSWKKSSHPSMSSPGGSASAFSARSCRGWIADRNQSLCDVSVAVIFISSPSK
jgi:hypothetical protein